MQPQQMSFRAVAEDVKGFSCPDVSVELVLPLWGQDREQSGFS